MEANLEFGMSFFSDDYLRKYPYIDEALYKLIWRIDFNTVYTTDGSNLYHVVDFDVFKERIQNYFGFQKQPLKPTFRLYLSSLYHSVSSRYMGFVGHQALYLRMILGFNFLGKTGENCSYGYNDSESIVMSLLIDEGVASLGHRKNILSKDFKRVGVAIGKTPNI